ncbi:MAG: diguanylate cyclase [Eubacteriales bacterium]|nr:diguanylate cyclase [Eubacteriales bacterium]
MKSLTTKLSVAMIACMLVAVSLVSAIYSNQTMELHMEESQQIVNLMCDNCARALDAKLVAIQRSVDLLNQHSSFFLHDDGQPFQERIQHLERISLSTADYTPEAYAVYFHCNPEKYDPAADFFYFRDPHTGNFKQGSVMQASDYEKETGLSADWYFASAETMEPRWLDPYSHIYNGDGREIVVASYTVPLLDHSEELLGVLGMDYTFADLSTDVSNIRLYETGYAFLCSGDGTIISHPRLPFGTKTEEVQGDFALITSMMEKGETPEKLYDYRLDGEEKQLTFSTLRNGVCLVVTAPTDEINASVTRMARKSQILFLVVMISSVMIIYCIVYKTIHPLQLLTYASQQIIKGNMQVELPYHASDEIGELTDNFRKMSLYLQEHISRINTMAYTDAMTGLKNKASYQAAVSLLQERIRQGFCDFAVVVFGLNNLKSINDSLGHVAGDHLIKNAGRAISKAFAHSPVFRIGGDEFVAILENDDLRDSQGCLERLNQVNQDLNDSLKEEERISMAYGMARFQKDQDQNYRDVFSRADREMYRNKLAAKKEKAASPRSDEAD